MSLVEIAALPRCRGLCGPRRLSRARADPGSSNGAESGQLLAKMNADLPALVSELRLDESQSQCTWPTRRGAGWSMPRSCSMPSGKWENRFSRSTMSCEDPAAHY